jgi:hypothetical protein
MRLEDEVIGPVARMQPRALPANERRALRSANEVEIVGRRDTPGDDARAPTGTGRPELAWARGCREKT